MNKQTCIGNHLNSIELLFSKKNSRWLLKLLKSTEAIRLFNALDNEIFQEFGNSPLSLLVSSVESKEGRTSIALLLGVLSALYNPENKVLLIDTDLEKGELASIMGLPKNTFGLCDYFSGKVTAANIIQNSNIRNLDLITIGRSQGFYIRFLHDKFARLIEEVRGDYKLIVADSKPASGNKEVFSLAKVLENVIIIIRYGGPNREQIQMVLSEMQRVQARILGAVLNQRLFPIPKFLYGFK